MSTKITYSQEEALELVQTWLPDKKHVDLDPLGPGQKHFLFTLRMYVDEDRFRPSPKQIKYLFDLHKTWKEAPKVVGKLPEGAHELANRIVQLKHDALAMGMLKTGHALEEVTQAVGWEMAEILEGKRADHK